jgi:hypothetical protein
MHFAFGSVNMTRDAGAGPAACAAHRTARKIAYHIHPVFLLVDMASLGPRSQSAEQPTGLSTTEVAAVTEMFESRTADWALFGYTSAEDTRMRLSLKRTGLCAVDGPIESNLDAQSIAFGVAKVTIPSEDGGRATEVAVVDKDGKVSESSSSPLHVVVSFGFFGEFAPFFKLI